MVSLHGFSILILLTQSNHKSALLFSCTCPFSGACRYYTTFFLKSQTYVHIFLKKIKNFSELSTNQKERSGITNKTYRSPATKVRPPREKRQSASGSARTPFRGGPFCRCVFFLFRPFGIGGLSLSSTVAFRLFLGVSLSAAARSAAALVYDKLTPNCHLL